MTSSAQVVGEGGSVPQTNYNGQVFPTKASHLTGVHRLWSNLEMDVLCQVKMCKIRHKRKKLRNHLWRPRLWNMSVTDGGEWWTSQDVGTLTTPSGVKGERRRRKRRNPWRKRNGGIWQGEEEEEEWTKFLWNVEKGLHLRRVFDLLVCECNKEVLLCNGRGWKHSG